MVAFFWKQTTACGAARYDAYQQGFAVIRWSRREVPANPNDSRALLGHQRAQRTSILSVTRLLVEIGLL